MAQKKKGKSGGANRATAKEAARQTEKAAKKNPKAFLTAVAIILVLAIAAAALWYFLVYRKDAGGLDSGLGTGTEDGSGGSDEILSGSLGEIVSADLSVHFIAPAVKASGDCTLIKVGDIEVLIDAGPTQGNAAAIKEYLSEYCTDNVLEYVIVTHGDSDHISGMVGTSTQGSYNGILYSYKIGTVIQFDKTNQSLTTDSGNPTLYSRYVTAVNYAQSQGAQVYTALQCWNGTDGAQRTYYLDGEAHTISMNILYNYYYDHDASDENNYSVCMLLSQETGDSVNHYLFTGDLEEDGERRLVENNDLPQVELYKAGHHGSKTSSTDKLLEVIRPKYVAVCCCAGYNQYSAAAENVFPTQAFIDRVSAYTDAVYVPIQWDSETNGYKDMNGNIVFYYGKGEDETEKSLKLYCSDNTTKLKDSEWFLANRSWNGV